MKRRCWNVQEDATLREMYPTTTAAAIGARLGRSTKGVDQRTLHLKLSKAPTRFVKGQAGAGWKPVGSTVLNHGFLYTKVSDQRNVPWTVNWKPAHTLLWEQHRGPVPFGYVLIFTDGNRANVTLDNLALLSRSDLYLKSDQLPEPIRQTAHLLGVLTRQINRRTA